MAKAKASESVPNRHLYSRISYLHQAATYLASQTQSTEQEKHKSEDKLAPPPSHNLARHLVAGIRTVGRKALIRPSPRMKQSLCKHCDSVLIEGKTCITSVENASKGGKKPWADMLVVRCLTCENVKRFPVNMPRQKRKGLREPVLAKAAEG
ncbi:RNAse P Rpr2/Rpp21/SNM1 subunit domain-containing protein [Plectosphaerella plurivora]|uniref:RNAse P Rpr2/Rpp21/SNM1 subunit domain-containing protein n=1 Tax=Plectosphaerella plurivora TaxID=936078 RepID=A0A9P9A6B5_9PEZI|nr:RNAse P Rpr2/Rpp21/SNM1 subunit domain-containing protein [Plectosphaerella plurivora]